MCVGGWGCYQSPALPTPAIHPRATGTPPTIGPQQPVQSTPQLTENPWKPLVPARDWQYIVIHHTASSSGSVESIHEAHIKRKDKSGNPWQGIGYHFVIGNGSGMGDGVIEPTFRWREQMHGAHAGSNDHNQHGVGVCLVGNFEETSPSAEQLAAVKRLVGILKTEYGINSDGVIAHRDVKATACPGKYFPLDEVSRSGANWLIGRAAAAPTTTTQRITPVLTGL
ncbi:MAG: N-acetylmuramoyl-L-alanine amidase [Planctomycetaceae bacterium]|nr:N-acetylmuramoyl-L-alanine amidase [Planctomycetaceae bacterium]